MKIRLLIASGVCLAALAALSVPADAKTMKECAAQWQEMKAANQTGGMKYRDFSKQCMSEGAPPAAAPPPAAEKPVAPPPATAEKPASGGRQAMIARERACGAEWKQAKAEGKIPVGQKWPQYWSECNKRKKAEGM
jgi:protein-disulfide isomerase